MGGDRFRYLWLAVALVVATVPAEAVLGVRVWRRPRRLLRAAGPAVVLFAMWDAWAVRESNWQLNVVYSTGWRVPPGVPVEELLVLCAIAIWSVLLYETFRTREHRA